MSKYLLSLALAVVSLLATPGDSHAQRGGRGQGGVSISVGGYPSYGYNSYGYSGWGYNPSYGYANGGYYPRSNYYSNWNYYPSSAYYSPSYRPAYSSGSYFTEPTYSSVAPSRPTTTTSFYYSPANGEAPANMTEKAEIEVRLPANAELWLDGAPTAQRGQTRTFESPPLELGRTFTYEFRARWMEDGQVKEDARRVDAFAGAKKKIEFGKR